MNDEIIAEVRAIKDAIGAKFNYDLRALFEEIKRDEAELQAKGIKLVPVSYTHLDVYKRQLHRDRLREIGTYLSTEESTFPNSIILAPNFDLESGLPVDNSDIRWRVVEKECTCVPGDVSYSLTIPTDEALAPIIDGQHRLFGFNFCDKPDRMDMGLVCSIFLDLPKPFQAFLFATINSNQRPVNKSQTYEAFGYNIEKELPDSWSPDKLAVFLARKLNAEDDSPLKGRILIAAENDFAMTRIEARQQGTWMVSMATVVDCLLYTSLAWRSAGHLVKPRCHQRLLTCRASP